MQSTATEPRPLDHLNKGWFKERLSHKAAASSISADVRNLVDREVIPEDFGISPARW